MSSSSKSILKSTGIIGASSVIALFFNLLRSKVVAVLLGPSGTGLIGALESSTSLVQGVAGLGVQNSAVRDIAQSKATGERSELAKAITTLRRVVFFTGLTGLLLTVGLAQPISELTFGREEYTWEIRLLAIAVFFNLIKAGQSALIQGMRRIKDLAYLSIAGAVLSSVFAIPLIFWMEEDGIPLYIISVAIGQYIVSWYFARKIKVEKVTMTLHEVWQNARSMLQLGVSFMGGSLFTLGTAYLIRVIIIREFELNGAGLYQAAMAISGMYINVVLQAMSKDFYPRLAAVAGNNQTEISLINDQTEVGMLLAAPGLLLTLALAPYAIEIFYSAEYVEAYSILQWSILGVFIRTVTWPMGYLFIARGRTNIFFLNQVVGSVFHLVALFLCIEWMGLNGTGVAFFIMYLLHLVYMYILARKTNGFRWRKVNGLTLIVFALIFAVSIYLFQALSQVVAAILVLLIFTLTTVFIINRMKRIIGIDSISNFLSEIRRRKKQD